MFWTANIGKRSVRSINRNQQEITDDGLTMDKNTLQYHASKFRVPKIISREDHLENSNDKSTLRNKFSKENSKKLEQKIRIKRKTSSKTKNITKAARPKMATSSGAGQSMGLTLVLNAEKNKYFMTSAFFEGFKVIILGSHSPISYELSVLFTYELFVRLNMIGKIIIIFAPKYSLNKDQVNDEW